MWQGLSCSVQEMSSENLLSNLVLLTQKTLGCVPVNTSPCLSNGRYAKMYYCFISEEEVSKNDLLFLQRQYAKRIQNFCVLNLTQQTVSDCMNQPLDLAGEKVLLRCTCDNMIRGLRMLKKCGAELIETEENISRIENWYTLNLTNRKFWETNLTEISKVSFDSDLLKYLLENEAVFLKSRQKGFSAVIKSLKILEQDYQIVNFLKAQCLKYGERLLLTEYQGLKTDSLGSRESRHVIMNNQIVNSSRLIHSVRHTVPKSHRIRAQEIADYIRSICFFPANYVLDIGDFIGTDKRAHLDIVEINPLSCSMCYVNNSVFTTIIPEISEISKQFLMGPEYCYDALSNPQNYLLDRSTNKEYTYLSENRWAFL